MRIATTLEELRSLHGGVLVPTMGALHEGHSALIRDARRVADARGPGAGAAVVVSVFVNPTQFESRADLERYPRSLDRDAEVCAAAGADAVFAPSQAVVYPQGASIPVPPLPGLATEPRLEDLARPGHFAGVCQVVQRLFDLIRPRTAVFGEKDWQQLQVVRALSRSLQQPVEIVPVATVREKDGLAMSSRNVFLTPGDRVRALSLWRAMRSAGAAATPAEAEERLNAVLFNAGVRIEYAVVRDAETLMPLLPLERPGAPARCLVAARVGPVRLIDNAPWFPQIQ